MGAQAGAPHRTPRFAPALTPDAHLAAPLIGRAALSAPLDTGGRRRLLWVAMAPIERPLGVSVAAMVIAIGSGLAIAVGLVALTGVMFYPLNAPGGPSRVLLIVSPVILIGAGLWGLATARGLMQIKPWARTSIILFSVLLAFLGTMGMFQLLTSPFPSMPPLSAGELRGLRDLVVVVYFLFLVIGVWWIVQFSSPPIKSLFRLGAKEAVPRAPAKDISLMTVEEALAAGRAKYGKRPLSITLIAWYLLAAAISAAVQVLVGAPASVFGLTLSGSSASLLYLGMFGVEAYIGIGLLYLQPLSRILGIVFFVLQFLLSVLVVALPGREARLAAMLHAVSGPDVPAVPTAALIVVLVVSAAILAGLPVWFLIRRGYAFSERAPQQR